MGLELASFLLALGFYLRFLLSFLCPLGEKNGGEAEPYPVEEGGRNATAFIFPEFSRACFLSVIVNFEGHLGVKSCVTVKSIEKHNWHCEHLFFKSNIPSMQNTGILTQTTLLIHIDAHILIIYTFLIYGEVLERRK